MKCPYRKIVVHAPRRIDGYHDRLAKEIEEFPECYKEECPLYIDGRCVRVAAETRGEDGQE